MKKAFTKTPKSKAMEHFLKGDPRRLAVYNYLLENACWKPDGEVRNIQGVDIAIQHNELVVAVRSIPDNCKNRGVTYDFVRWFLKDMVDHNIIEMRKESRFTIIKITHEELHRSGTPQPTPQSHRSALHRNQHRNHKQGESSPEGTTPQPTPQPTPQSSQQKSKAHRGITPQPTPQPTPQSIYIEEDYKEYKDKNITSPSEKELPLHIIFEDEKGKGNLIFNGDFIKFGKQRLSQLFRYAGGELVDKEIIIGIAAKLEVKLRTSNAEDRANWRNLLEIAVIDERIRLSRYRLEWQLREAARIDALEKKEKEAAAKYDPLAPVYSDGEWL